MGKEEYLTDGAGITRYSHAKEWSWTPSSHSIQKLIKDVKIRAKMINLWERDKSIKIHNLGLSNGVIWAMTPKAQENKRKNR